MRLLNKEKFSSMEELYLGSYKLIYTFIFEYTDNITVAEEISSIVWIKINTNPKRYLDMDKQKLFNYLKLMVKTTYIDYYNKQKKEAEKLKDFYEVICEDASYFNCKQITIEDDNKYLKKALNVLTEEEKILINLRYNDNLKYKELGRILNISEGAIRTRQSRIFDKLRNEIIRLKRESEC